MDLIPYLSAVILVSTLATVLLAVLSYAAFKLRDKRRPKRDEGAGPVYFHRYELPKGAGEGRAGTAAEPAGDP